MYKINPEPVKQKSAKPAESQKYLAWIRTLECVVTGNIQVDAAHLNTRNRAYGHKGRGKAQRASDRWALPLCREQHDTQHSGEEIAFWIHAGINPYRLATTLYGIWCELGNTSEAHDMAIDVIRMAKIGWDGT